jgi:hypothetical protein
MGASTILIVVFVVTVATLLGLWAYRRSTTPAGALNGNRKTANQAEQWGVRISAPARERACPEVRELLGKEFPSAGRPQLPLPSCPYSQQCECRYIRLFNRRKQERRSGPDRRLAGQRFEKDKAPRRSRNDRRRQIQWF